MNLPEPKRPEAVAEAQALFLRHNPACAITGTTDATQAHHMVPYGHLCKIDREWLAEDQRIFIGLCETEKGKPEPNYHLLAGHAGSFEHANLHVEEDVAYYKAKGYKATAEIEADPHYLARKASRFKRAEEMTDEDIKALQEYVDARWPKPEEGQANE